MPLVTTPIPGCGDGLQVQKGKKGWLKRRVTCFLPVLCPTSFHSFPPPEGSHIGSFAHLTDTFPVWKRPQRDIPRHNHRAQQNQCEMVVWGAVKKTHAKLFLYGGSGRTADWDMFRQLCSGRAFLTLDWREHTRCGPFECHHTFKKIYRDKILGTALDSFITPQKHVHMHTKWHSISSANMPRLSALHTRTRIQTNIQTHVSLIRKQWLVDKWHGVHILPLAWQW